MVSMTGMGHGRENRIGSLRFSFVCTMRVRWIWGGGLLMIAGALLSGCGGGSAMNKGLLTLLLLFTCLRALRL